jgi:uncharacterized protein (TIGR00730 family)
MDRSVKDTWTVFKIMGEFVEGFETLRDVWPAVSVFGGARVRRSSPHYRDGVRLAHALGTAGFNVITGGGPGLMEAANRGAAEAGSRSIGLNIKLPAEQSGNQYADTSIDFNYFFARKVMFLKYTCGVVGMPGGFGTMDEIFECLTLVQTQKIKAMPIVLYGERFWRGLLDWIIDQPLDQRLIKKSDLRLFQITDDPDQAAEIISRHYQRQRRHFEHDLQDGRDIP